MAATAPSHCLDGWTFLSRALGALLAGDAHTTRHLAYYAQLRAALSILGCNGIGIFNAINFAVDNSLGLRRLENRNPRRRGLGTHTAAWDVLEVWASEPQTAKTFLQSIRFRDVSLSDCIDAIWPSSALAPLAAKVIETWGVDLQRAAEDHESRNISSYAVHVLNQANSSLPERLELIHDLWIGLQPEGQGTLPHLDRHLLRKFLELAWDIWSKTFGIRTKQSPWSAGFLKLDPIIQGFVSTDFLNRIDEPSDPIVFFHADNNSPGDVHGMVCRALLLLRTATSIVRTAFIDAGFQPLADNVPPWFEVVGIDRGFWSDNELPENIADLWSEVGYAVSELAESMSSKPSNQWEFTTTGSTQAVFLSQAERACMWAVCS